MVSLSRRAFLAGVAGISIGAVSTNLPVTWDDVYRLTTETSLQSDDRILVLVTLYGGNDGLNTVIPYTQSAYHDARPELAYTADEVIDLDGEYGLNPGLKNLAKTFEDGHLAIVRGVGYPEQDRSHFRSMDIWQTGTMDNGVDTGWIGRWLDLEKTEPLKAVSIGSVLPTLAIGSKSTAATLVVDRRPSSDDFDLMTALATADESDAAAIKTVRESYSAASAAARKIDELLYPDETAAPEANGEMDRLSRQLDAVGRCIRAGLPTRVYCVSLGGFDTHADEKDTQRDLLKTLDTALGRFLKDMAKDERGKNVVVMAYSEFGRRVAANASDGTDHGTSGPVFIAGAPVRGGFYGDDPSLKDLTRGDLKTTTDFRDVYAELLTKTLGADPDPIVGPKRKPIGFLA